MGCPNSGRGSIPYMIKFILIILLLIGGGFFMSRKSSLESELKYVEEHKAAFWAPRAHYSIAWTYYYRGDYPEAQAAFEKFLADYDYPIPTYVDRVLFYLEDSAENNKDWEAAKAPLERYISQFPDGPDINLMRQRRENLRYQHGL
jgi:outer membrane protein assembly factor BamD (BamD/ComL family)